MSAAFDQQAQWQRLVAHLHLEPHPEGGFYRRTYESDLRLSTDLEAAGDRFRVRPRACSTAIYFLLPRGSVSHLHCIPSDELWHFYLGGPLTIVEIDPVALILRETVLGADLFSSADSASGCGSHETGMTLQHCVRAGSIFGAYPCANTEFALVGCTVAPGFEFGDFEMCSRSRLLATLPAAMHDTVHRLTAP